MIEFTFFSLIVRRDALVKYPGGEVALAAEHSFDQYDDALLVRVAMAAGDLQAAWDALTGANMREGEDFVVIDIGGDQIHASVGGGAFRYSPVPWLRIDIDARGRATAEKLQSREA